MSDDKNNNNKPTGEIIEGHEYDGIQELDHPLPKWWVNLFYGTIIFAAGYYAYYTFLGGPTHVEQYEAAMAKIEARQVESAEAEASAPVAEVNVEALLKSPEALAVGASVFKQTCAACHGADGGGVIGPNLTDKNWIHSTGDFEGIMQAMLKGFPEKGMPPFKDIVPAAKHAPLVAYVMTLQGTSPANPKAPQGDLVD